MIICLADNVYFVPHHDSLRNKWSPPKQGFYIPVRWRGLNWWLHQPNFFHRTFGTLLIPTRGENANVCHTIDRSNFARLWSKAGKTFSMQSIMDDTDISPINSTSQPETADHAKSV